jgi:hypothetical protein
MAMSGTSLSHHDGGHRTAELKDYVYINVYIFIYNHLYLGYHDM